MKKLLTILTLLVAFVTQGWADDAISLAKFSSMNTNAVSYGSIKMQETQLKDPGIEYLIGDGSTYAGEKLVVITSKSVKLSILVGAFNSEASGETTEKYKSEESATLTHEYTLDDAIKSKNIQKIQIRDLEESPSDDITIERIYLVNGDKKTYLELSNFQFMSSSTPAITTVYTMITDAAWNGIQDWIGDNSSTKGNRLVIKTTEAAKLKVSVGYVGDASADYNAGNEGATERILQLQPNMAIQKIQIQQTEAGDNNAPKSVTFTDISIDNSSEDSPVEVVKLNLLNAMNPDDKTTYTDPESNGKKKMETSASWAGISISNNLQASTIYVKATDADNKDSKLKIAAYYSDGWSTEYFNQIVNEGKTLKFDETRTITYLQIQNQEDATSGNKKSITFSDIYIDTPTETPTYAESFQIRIDISSMASEEIATYADSKLTISASKTASLDLSGVTSLRQGKNLVVNLESEAKINVTVTYADESSCVYNAGESGATTRSLKLEDKAISKIEIENAETSTSTVITSLYLNEADNSSSEEGSTSVDYGTELTTSSTLPVATGDWASYIQYANTLFSNAKVGDIITASISDVDAGDQIALQSDWKNLNSTAGPTLAAGATSWQYTLTASGINQLIDNGLIVKGKNITINKVYLKSVGSVNPTISEVALANFDDMDSKGSKQLYAGSNSTISARNKQLVVTTTAAAKLTVAVYLVGVDNPITEEVTTDGTAKSEYSVSLGSEDKKIKKILITNNGTEAVTYSSISLEDYVDPNLIWSGSQELTSTALDIAADKFNNVESGNRIRLTIGSISDGDMKVTYTQDANTYETFNGSVEASKTYDFEITPTNIEAIKANGISITGSNATLTKIERITDGYSEGTPSLDDLPAGWNAEYNSTDKVITFSGEWKAKGWNIGTATYNEKKDFVVTFAEKPVKTGTTGDPVNVKLNVDYVNQYGKTETLSNSTSTDLSVSIPLKENEQITNGIVRIINILIKTDVATTLKLSSVAFNEYVPRTPKDLSTGSQKIRAHSSVAINKSLFTNAVAGDVLTINVPEIAEGAKYTLKGWNQDTRSEGNKNWSSFLDEQELATNATSITCTLNADILNIIQNAGLSIEGNGFTCGNVTLSTAGVVGAAQTHTNPTFALTVNATGGNVAVYQENGTTPATGGPYEIETNLVLKATPNANFGFVKWTEGTTDLAANEDKSLSITMDNNREITAVFSTNPLEYEDERTLFEGGVDITWRGVAIQPSTVGAILEAGEQLILTTTVAEGAFGQVEIRGSSGAIAGSYIGGLVNGENVITLTSAMVEAMREEFGFWGENATLTKVVLYKPDVIFVDGEANLERGVEDGGKTTFTAPHDEAITGNVLVVESNENAAVKVTFSDNTTATNKPGDRKIGNPTGSQALVLLDRSKFIKTIEIDKAKAAITKIYMSSLTLFEKSGEDYIADLSLAKAMDNTTFDTSSYTIATTVAWSGGIQLDVLEGETVKGKELMIQTESDADLKVTVEYESGDKTEVQDRPASKEMKVVIDGNRAVKQILIQPKTASVTKLLKVAVNASATPDPNVFSKDDKGNFVADLSMVKAEGATYNNTTFTMVATDSWQGVTVTPGNAEVVKGKELYIEFDKAALGYAKISYVDDETSVEGGLDAAGTVMKIALDDSKQISKIEIKLKEAGTAKFKKIAVNATETADESGDDDEEAIIDEKTGEADLTVLAPQDDTKTTLTENEDGSITMTTTEPYCAAQIWFSDPEPVAGNVLKVELAESNVNVTVTVKYTDGTESQMSANTMVANARAMTRAVASARAATRGDSDSGTTVEVPLETGKEVQNIEVKNNVAGTITIKKMQVTTINVFTHGEANLSMLKPQSNATYDTAAHTLATTKGWTGATISPVAGENVSGKELLIEFADASKVKVAVKYRTDVEGPSTIMEKAAKAVRLALDNTKNIQEISIQPTEASIVTFTKIAVNSEESDDGTLKPGKTITLWESAAGETLSWNEVANQDASVGEMLQEYDELLITISGVTEGCDWPKVFIRDASSEQAGNEVLLNDIGSFPYTVRIVLTGEMAQQLQEGFSICGDGVTVTKLQVYRPEAPKTGDIHLADLNYGYNSSYDKGTHTITTTARWAARGWEIGDKRYNDKNLITVKFEPVDFPVTLKMEYTTGIQTAQATSVGVPAGRTELLLEIPSGISKLNRVYIIYENPGSVKLTEASVTYQDKLKLSTAIEAFEAEGVIHDGRYDTDGWYNLRGMRIAEPKTCGIYIHGGKKVVIY